MSNGGYVCPLIRFTTVDYLIEVVLIVSNCVSKLSECVSVLRALHIYNGDTEQLLTPTIVTCPNSIRFAFENRNVMTIAMPAYAHIDVNVL